MELTLSGYLSLIAWHYVLWLEKRKCQCPSRHGRHPSDYVFMSILINHRSWKIMQRKCQNKKSFHHIVLMQTLAKLICVYVYSQSSLFKNFACELSSSLKCIVMANYSRTLPSCTDVSRVAKTSEMLRLKMSLPSCFSSHTLHKCPSCSI